MFSINTLQEIFSSLKHNKLRTALTGLSVSWGIFILIVLLGAGNGLKNAVMSNFSDRATNMVEMWPGTTSQPYMGLKSGRRMNFSEKELNSISEKIPEANGQTGVIEKQSTITYHNEFGSYSVKGVEPSYNQIYNLRFEPQNGRFVNELDSKLRNKVIVLDKKIVEELFKKESALGKYVQVGTVVFKVVGVNSKKERWGNGSAYIPFSTAQLIYNPNRKFGSIAMKITGLETEGANLAFDKKLTNTMSKTMRFDPEDNQALYLRNAQRDYLQTMTIFGGITMFVSFIGILTLIAGIVGVSNIMLVSVKERTREIGIRKAIGAPPSNILRSIILESILITGIFGYVGIMMGIGLTELVNYIMLQTAAASPDDMSVFKNPTVDLSIVFISTLILVLSGVIAGYMPARRAVRIKPIEAMREQ